MVPTKVQALAGVHIIQVDCGSGDAHTLALDKTGKVWSWGDGDYGKLGRGGGETTKVPKAVNDLDFVDICKVMCGNQFSLALTKDGKLYTWLVVEIGFFYFTLVLFHRGSADTYQLGHNSQEHVRSPKLVDYLSESTLIDISVGAQHCLALTDTGDVYSWGKNSCGEVDGSGDVVLCPTLIKEVSGEGAFSIACGAFEVSLQYTVYWMLISFKSIRVLSCSVKFLDQLAKKCHLC